MTPMRHKALRSLFGSKSAAERAELLREYLASQHVVQVARTESGVSVGAPSDDVLAQVIAIVKGKGLAGNRGAQDRKQTVLTPPWLLDCMRSAFGPIGLDPCTTGENPCQALVTCDEQTDGLKQPWHRAPGWFYCNPPYKQLKDWLQKARDEHAQGARGVMLAPKRGHRRWFAPLTSGLKIANLAPFAFVGHAQAFPAPLCLVFYGLEPCPVVDLKGRNMVTSVEGMP